MNKYLLAILLIISHIGFGQKITVSGTIFNNSNNEPIAGAVILNKTNNSFVISNEYGAYSIDIEKNTENILQITFIGFDTATFTVTATKNVEKDIYLQEGVKISDVIIIGHKRNNDNSYYITQSEIKSLPSLTGEFDVLKSFQYMAGVQFGAEGTSNLYVLGGSVDQNLITIDDIPLFYVTHLGNFVSIFDIEAIRQAKLVKSGFAPKYGGKQSAFIDIILKNGDMHKRNYAFNIGLISSKFSSNGYIVKNKLSYLLTFRRSNLDWFEQVKQLFTKNDYTVLNNFYDFNLKIFSKINTHNSLQFLIYSGSDRYKIKLSSLYFADDFADIPEIDDYHNFSDNSYSIEKDLFKWGNLAYGIKWIFNKNKFFGNTTCGYTRYMYDFLTQNTLMQKNDSLLRDIKTQKQNFIAYYFFKTDWKYEISRNLLFNIGGDYKFYINQPVYFSQSITTLNSNYNYILSENKYHNNLIASYLDINYNLKTILYLKLGLRTSFFQDNTYHSPRIRVVLKPFKKLSVNTSYTRTYQFVHLLQTSTSVVPSDIWILSKNGAIPEYSDLLDLNFNFSSDKFDFTIGAFDKDFNNLIDYKRTIFNNNTTLWDRLVYNGTGQAQGAYLSIKYYTKKLFTRLSFLYIDNKRTFKELNLGEPFTNYYARKYNLNITSVYNFNKHWQVSALFSFNSGMPYTIPIFSYNNIMQFSALTNFVLNPESNSVTYNISTFDVFNYEVMAYSRINNYTLPVYHRLDIAVKYSWESNRKKRQQEINLNIYNAYNRMNPYYIFAEITTNKIQYYKYTLFPIIPSVSYSLKF